MANQDVIAQIERSFENPLKSCRIKALYLHPDIYRDFRKNSPKGKTNRLTISLVEKYLSNEFQIPDEVFEHEKIKDNKCNSGPTCYLKFPVETWRTFKKYTCVKDLEVNQALAAIMLTYLSQK